MDEYISLCHQGEKYAQDSKDYINAGHIVEKLIHSYVARKENKKVRECISRLRKYHKHPDSSTLGLINFSQSELYRIEKRYPAALKSISKALSFWRIEENYRSISFGLYKLAELQQIAKNFNAARQSYLEAIKISLSSHNYDYLCANTNGLAKLELNEQNWLVAERTAKIALTVAEKIRNHLEASISCRCIGIALLKQNKHQRALRYARRAISLLSNYRNLDLSDTESLVVECEQAIQSKHLNKQTKAKKKKYK